MMRPRLEKTTLGTVVARRIVLLFFVCALVPAALLGIVSYEQVRTQIEEQTRTRLRQFSKTSGMSIARRLDMAWTELSLVGAAVRAGATEGWRSDRQHLDDVPETFVSLMLVDSVHIERIDGRIDDRALAPPLIDLARREHLATGRPLLVVDSISTAADRMLLAIPVADRILWGELNPLFLWGLRDPQGAIETTITCVFTERSTPLWCDRSTAAPQRRAIASGLPSAERPYFEWRTDDGDMYLAGYWSLFLKFRYGQAPWIVVTSELNDLVLEPLASFRATFVRVILIALVIVLLLSNVQIRRSLEPLDQLHRGTERVAAGDYRTRVVVHSRDEFGALAESFNAMSTRIDRQFHELETRNEIDRVILSSLDRNVIVNTVLTEIGSVVDCDAAALTLLDAPGERTGIAFTSDAPHGTGERVRLGEREFIRMMGRTDSLIVAAKRDEPGCVTPALRSRSANWLLLPIFMRGSPIAVIAIGLRIAPPDEPTRERARRLADQVAVALANAELIEELNELSLGAMTAFARAIDAKSKWTAGHSERVTAMALRLGEEIGLADIEMERLRRGAILHDVGKIGVPAEVLDKPGKLTDAEMEIMRDHSRMGARILEPITRYADIIPIVLYHHERYDGLGYPDGLSGTAIPRLARILAVADVWDALASDRPYRPGMNARTVIDIMRDGSGTQFDPDVIDALFALLARDPAYDAIVRQLVGAV